MFFDSWYDLLRILIVGTCGYVGLVLLLRVTGKRTLAKMNAFDFVVTIALGSTLATLLLSSEVSLAEGVFAFVLLCALQYGVAFAALRSKRFERLIKSEPSLLLHRGHTLPGVLKKERVTEEEVLAAVRERGFADLQSVGAVVLETDGSFSVLGEGASMPADTLRNVAGAEASKERGRDGL
jgi:uncharacterized membrane protein YcaP (DUF421 family)